MTTFPVKVQLTPSELSFAMSVAGLRLASSPPTDRFEAKSISPYGSHLSGVIAEIAASRVFGGKVDQRILRHGDKHAPDLIDRQGRPLECKAVLWGGSKPFMKLNASELKEGRWYVPVRLSWPDRCEVHDAIPLDQIRSAGVKRDFGYGPRLCYEIQQEVVA